MIIDPQDVANKYNKINSIWNQNDEWHLRTHAMIQKFVTKFSMYLEGEANTILNAGSAGYSYGLNEKLVTHIDIADQKLSGMNNSVVGNIENMPFHDNSFDSILCVGSVINYCDPIIVFSEFSRVLKRNGKMILEFENSRTFELLCSKDFNKKIALVETFYGREREKLFYYSENFIVELAKNYKMKVVEIQRCHILSPFIYRLTKNESFSARIQSFDIVLKYIPFLNKLSSNSIFLFEK